MDHTTRTSTSAASTRVVDVLVPVALNQTYSYRVPRGMELEAGDVVNDTTTGGTAVPLAAEQGKNLATKRPSVEKTASHTLALVDAGYLVRMNVGSSNNLTVPPNSDVAFALDTMIDVAQMGAGQTTIVAGSGVTIRSSGAKLKLTGQYSAASLQKLGTNEWLLVGDITT